MAVVEKVGRRVVVRLGHPLYGEVAAARCPVLRARAIHRQLATALEATGARRHEDLLPLLTARLDGGERPPSQLLVEGGHRAILSFELALAERFARAALESGGGSPARYVLAVALANQGRAQPKDLLAGVDEAQASDEHQTAAAELQAWGLLSTSVGDPKEADQILLRAKDGIETDDLRDQLEVARAEILYYSGQPADAAGLLVGILHRPDASEKRRLGAALFAVPALASSGQTEQAITVADRWVEVAHALSRDLPFAAGLLLGGKVHALSLAGRLLEAEALVSTVYRTTLSEHAYGVTAMSARFLGVVMLARGRVATARRWLREAAGLLRSEWGVMFLSICLADLARAEALGGNLTAAGEALAEAQTTAPRWMAFAEPAVGLARAWLVAPRGEASTARAVALDAADRAQESGAYAYTALALHDVARLGDAPAVATRLRRLASIVEGPFAPACAAHAEALVARDGPRLDQASATFEAMGADLLAAEAAAEAAAIYRGEGRKASMRASSARARRLLEGCEGARTPALSGLAPDPLTPREREVAMLAAQHLTSTEIAQRLVLSLRTVENHLQRCYAKLGISSRSELRPVLQPEGRPGSLTPSAPA
jgi:ATP/maltotriose-dependent transcriptional regulator MalT